MKKKLLTILLTMQVFTAAFADNYYVFRFRASYDPQGKANVASVKLVYDAFTPYAPGDSMVVRGNLDTLIYKRVADHYRVDVISAVLYDSMGKVIFFHTFAWGTKNPSCAGYEFNNLLRGKACDSFSSAGLGTLCAALSMNWVNENSGRNITYSGGYWSQPFNITCDPDIPYIEPPLKLTAPCYFSYRNPQSRVHWYESVNANGPWHYIDTGYAIFPARVSARKGEKLFNVRRYYMCRVDTHQVMNLPDINSQSTGPVWFYLNPRYDSIQVVGKNCRDTGMDLVIHLKNDSFSQHRSGINIFLWDISDSGKSVRWYLGNYRSQSRIALNGKTGQKDPYTSVPTEGKVFHVKSGGRYAIYLDFTIWTGFDCEIKRDTISTRVPDGFTYAQVLNYGETCPGNRDGRWAATGKYRNPGDTAWVILSGIKYQLGDTIAGLPAGQWPVVIRNTGGCEFRDTLKIAGGKVFHRRFGIDTTLCKGQVLHIRAAHPEADSVHLLHNGIAYYSPDTFILADSGVMLMRWTNGAGCRAYDTIRIRRRELYVQSDFLLPSNARLSDTVWAVDHSSPRPDTCFWRYDRNGARFNTAGRYTLVSTYTDTGLFWLTRVSRFGDCGFVNRKSVHVLGDSAAGQKGSGLGFKGPLIQDFSIDPNPNDGHNFTIRVKLRDTADITIYKIDPVTGDVTGDIAFSGKRKYEFTAFRSYASGVFFLKLMAGSESKTIKVLVVQ